MEQTVTILVLDAAEDLAVNLSVPFIICDMHIKIANTNKLVCPI